MKEKVFMMDNQVTEELGYRTMDYLQISFIEKIEVGIKMALEYTTTTMYVYNFNSILIWILYDCIKI